jgi:hypothetical protein
MLMIVIVMAAQPPRADEIDEKTHHGDRDRFIVVNRLRSEEPLYRLPGHERRYPEQEQGAAVPTQHFDFPGAEGVTLVGGVAARE